MGEEVFQFLYVYFWKDVKPPVRHEATVGDEAMEVGMEVDQITEGLDRDHGARYAHRPVQGRAEKLFQTLIGALAELAQEFSIESKIGPQHLGYSKMPYTPVRRLSSLYDSTVATNICGDEVAFLVFKAPIKVIQIKDKDMAKAYKNYFKILWNNAKKYP